MSASAASHRWVDHTSEVELEVWAPDLAGLLGEAARALAGLLLRNQAAEPSGEPRLLEVESHDREALLVDWLNEVLFVAETRMWVPVRFEVLDASDTRVRARAWGVPVDEPPSLVKAATFHGLQVREEEDGCAAEVIFDV
jgi:SHS2 domain-containing protein